MPTDAALEDAEHTANIVIIRDTGAKGSACFLSVHLNGVLAARLDTGEVASFFIKPGEVVIRAGLDPEGKFLCASSLAPGMIDVKETIMKEGEEKVFSIGMSMASDIRLMRVDK